MAIRRVKLLPHQLDFIRDNKTRYLALIAGYGSGKTKALICKAIDLASQNTGCDAGLFSATHELASDVLIPAMDEHLEEFGIPYKFVGSPNPRYIIQFPHGKTRILLKSFENWKRIIAHNYAFACVDELDTVEPAIAQKAWNKLMGRVRRGKVPQIAVATTPEGFRLAYKIWVKEAKDKHGNPKSDRRIIQARTTDNPFLDPEYIPSLMENYPPELVKAYINGEFVNLTSGTIYGSFDRNLNHTDRTVEPGDRLHIGMDFNVGKMSAIVHVVDDGLPRAVDELTELFDTPDMIRAITERYDGYRITIYPDASGENRSTKNASQSDITLLKQAGFTVKVGKSNPPVRDRINAMNAAFLNAAGDRRYLVNTKTCPKYTESLEQQVWVNGEPDKKSGHDHTNDAGGYAIYSLMPVNAPRKNFDAYFADEW